MFDHHRVAYDGGWFMFCRNEGADYGCSKAPLRVRLKPLRYSFTLFPGTERHRTLNKDGRLALHWSNLNWHIWRKWLWM